LAVDQGVIIFRLAAGNVLVDPHEDRGFQVAGYVLSSSTRDERRGSVVIQTVTILKEGISPPYEAFFAPDLACPSWVRTLTYKKKNMSKLLQKRRFCPVLNTYFTAKFDFACRYIATLLTATFP
jgi:hypothetical protein